MEDISGVAHRPLPDIPGAPFYIHFPTLRNFVLALHGLMVPGGNIE